jgi:uncharacterized membrane protein
MFTCLHKHPLPDITTDTLWQHKKNAGVDFFGIGNEPFWNIEIDEQGQTTIRMADWESAVSLKTPWASLSSKDSIVYQFADATKTRLFYTISPAATV